MSVHCCVQTAHTLVFSLLLLVSVLGASLSNVTLSEVLAKAGLSKLEAHLRAEGVERACDLAELTDNDCGNATVHCVE